MKIAIIGSGISGLVAAYLLNKQHDITLFEARNRLGGHTATTDVSIDDESLKIDTGFIVFNDWTYPNFIRLMDEIGVASQESDMSFGVCCEETGLEYAGSTGTLALLDGLFAQRSNLLSPRHIGFLLEIIRFNKQAIRDLENDSISHTINLQEYVVKHRFSDLFVSHYLVPMTSAIWSTPFDKMFDFPMKLMLPFMYKHGLLNVKNRPRWRTIINGSQSYIAPLSASFKEKIRLETPVTKVERGENEITVHSGVGSENFDQVVLACHSDDALRLLSDASNVEKMRLGAIRYQENSVILHTDISQMPKQKRAWASWNYRLKEDKNQLPIITYDMNRLMSLSSKHRFMVTLNNDAEIDESKILGKYCYGHPVFNREAVETQNRWQEINGEKRTWFCGAWWGKGFHEDGVNSAIRVAEELGVAF